MPLRRPIPEPLPHREAEPRSHLPGAHRNALPFDPESETARPLSFEIDATGAVRVHGLGHAPVTLTCAQWRRLLDQAEELRSFLEQK